MGLTLHYTLRHARPLTPARAEALVRQVRRAAARLVKERELAAIGRVRKADPENPWSCRFVLERRGADTVGHGVRPDCGWMFRVQPGEGCESAEFGLCRYPATIRVGRRTLRTGCAGWGFAGFCKTQYASLRGWDHFLKCHRAVTDLVLLWEAAGAEVTIKDEGDYWPGRNEARLRASLGEMNGIVAAMAGALKDAADEGGPAVESPIFAHGQFELLEAEGMARHAARIGQAAGLARKVVAQPGLEPGT